MSDLRQNLQQRRSAEKPTRVELLAPAGSFDAMRAAINAGADAVYMGGSRFGARAYADNPDEEGIIKAIEYCHLRGKKLYMTVNTLFRNEELYDCLFEFLKPYYEAGLDAVIVQDAGAMRYISEKFPDMPIHISTQATVTGAEGANELKSRGYNITRVVPARELSLKELKNMRENTELEMEVFIHGALCYCYSGQCLLSSMAGGRSGNRGRCAQPCRRLYSAKEVQADYSLGDEIAKAYYLSPKDMCVLPHIHEMIDAGINSFKIEGRMKSPEYCAGVVSIYRRFIDSYYELRDNGSPRESLEESLDNLRELYNRGGFNEGYLFKHNGQDMMSMERPNHSGVELGKVIGVSGRRADIMLFKAVGKGDVLEIRGENGKAVFEYTVGEAITAGSKTSVITMKDRTATVGLKVYRTKNDGLLRDIREKYIDNDLKVPVDICFTAVKGREAELRCSSFAGDRQFTFTFRGNIVEKALNAPITEDKLIKQLSKLGETEFTAGELSVTADEDIFIPVGELNRLRREAIEGLRQTIIDHTRRDRTEGIRKADCESRETETKENGKGIGAQIPGMTEIWNNKKDEVKNMQIETSGAGNDDFENKPMKTAGDTDASSETTRLVVSVSSFSQLESALRYGEIDEIYYNVSSFSFDEADRVKNTVELYRQRNGRPDFRFALPVICRKDKGSRTEGEMEEFCIRYKACGFVARNYETVALLKKIGADYRTDYNIYAMNSLAAKEAGTGFTFSPEMTVNEIKENNREGLSGEMIVYGLMPVMVSAQCVYKNVTGICRLGKRVDEAEKLQNRDKTVEKKVLCHEDRDRENAATGTNNPDVLSLTDEKGFTFRTCQQCSFCYNIIYNSAVTNIMDKTDSIKNTGVRRLRADLTFENAGETGEVLNNLTKLKTGGEYTMPTEIMGMKYTNGHYFKPVE